MHSHHSHSGQFCKHASSSLREVISVARGLGFTHFHFSEHCPREQTEDLYPEEVEAGLNPQGLLDTFVSYLHTARCIQAEERVNDGIHILVGCETENITPLRSISYLSTILSRIGGQDTDNPPPYVGAGVVDYMVGSVHHVHGVPIDFDKGTFEKALSVAESGASAYNALVSSYLDLQYEVMERLRPEIIGHMDLYRLYFPTVVLDTPALNEKLDRNIRYAASYGALFEANSAAFRKGWNGETYPGRHVLCHILAAGGRIALSDDSHGTAQVSLNYVRMREYLLAEGVDEIWYLEADDAEWPTLVEERRTSFETAEQARRAREALAAPGLDTRCPVRFPRGTRAISMKNWDTLPFWDGVSERRTPSVSCDAFARGTGA